MSLCVGLSSSAAWVHRVIGWVCGCPHVLVANCIQVTGLSLLDVGLMVPLRVLCLVNWWV